MNTLSMHLEAPLTCVPEKHGAATWPLRPPLFKRCVSHLNKSSLFLISVSFPISLCDEAKTKPLATDLRNIKPKDIGVFSVKDVTNGKGGVLLYIHIVLIKLLG